MSLFGGGGVPDAPKQKKLNAGKLEDKAVKYDTEAYARADADLLKRFPSLVNARDWSIADSGQQLGGDIGSTTRGALESAGLGDEASRMSTGSEFKTALNMGEGILSKEQRDRNYFERVLAENPARKFGLSGADAVRIAMANTGNTNAINAAGYGTAVNASNAATLQGAQNFGALSNIITGAITNFSRSRSTSPYIDPYNSVYPSVAPNYYDLGPGGTVIGEGYG